MARTKRPDMVPSHEPGNPLGKAYTMESRMIPHPKEERLEMTHSMTRKKKSLAQLPYDEPPIRRHGKGRRPEPAE